MVSLIFAVLLIYSWVLQINQRVTSSSAIAKPDAINGYLEIQLSGQHPVEPTFNGRIFVYSLTASDAQHSKVTVLRSGDRSYGDSRTNIALISSPTTFHDVPTMETRSRDFTDFSLVAARGLHRYFPFDSAVFDFEIELSPPLTFNFVRVTNRVPGFIMGSEQVKAIPLGKGKFHLSFELRRSPLIQLSAIVLGVAGLVFLVIIMTLEKVELLAPSVASYFFALWSIRGILSSEIRVFPTLLDAWILTLCVVLVVLLIWKAAIRATARDA